jgi:DNA-binding response OmpR family regulator
MPSITDLSVSVLTKKILPAILVVEDEAMIRMFVTEFLEDCGHRVFEAASVAEAKDLLAETPVDLVFSDVNMPGDENGFALEKWLRRHYPDIKVLLTSGFPHRKEDTSGLREPMILKPFTCPALLARIDRLFGVADSLDQQTPMALA